MTNTDPRLMEVLNNMPVTGSVLSDQCAGYQRELERWQPSDHNEFQFHYVAPQPIDRSVQPSRQSPIWDMKEWALCGGHNMRHICPVTGIEIDYLTYVHAQRDARNLGGSYQNGVGEWYTYVRGEFPHVRRGRLPLNNSEGATCPDKVTDESHRAIFKRRRRRIAADQPA